MSGLYMPLAPPSFTITVFAGCLTKLALEMFQGLCLLISLQGGRKGEEGSGPDMPRPNHQSKAPARKPRP